MSLTRKRPRVYDERAANGSPPGGSVGNIRLKRSTAGSQSPFRSLAGDEFRTLALATRSSAAPRNGRQLEWAMDPDSHLAPAATPASSPRADGRKAEFEANKLHKRLCRQVGQAIGDFNMIEDGDR